MGSADEKDWVVGGDKFPGRKERRVGQKGIFAKQSQQVLFYQQKFSTEAKKPNWGIGNRIGEREQETGNRKGAAKRLKLRNEANKSFVINTSSGSKAKKRGDFHAF